MSGVLLANIKSPFPAAQLASAANLERQGEPGAALDRGSYVDLAPARNRLVRTLEFVERRRTASPSPASCGGSVRGSRWPVLLLGMSPAENWFSEVISQYDISKRRCSRELLPLALLGFVLRGGKQMPLPAASMQVQPLHLANNNSAGRDLAIMNASDVMVECLLDWGVDTIFGLPGDGINGIMESLRTHQDKIRFVHVRHEEAAAFMACGYAKYTGKLGVCLATSGPGGIHLLNGLYDAKLDGAPVLAITGLQFHDLIETHTQQDVELDKLFMDVAVYNARVMGPEHMENVVDLACRTAVSYRVVSH